MKLVSLSMKRLGLILLFGLFAFSAKAQLTHLSELPFPSIAVDQFNVYGSFSVYADGPYIISYMNNIVNDNDIGYIYNRNTDEIAEFPFKIRDQYQIGIEYFYGGVFTNTQFAYQYIKLAETGEIQAVQDFPVEPTFEYGGLTYGMNYNELWQFSTNPLEIKKVAVFDSPINYTAKQFSIIEDTVYVASVKGYDTFSLSDSTYQNPYRDFIADNQLELIPYSALNGRFLYYDSSIEEDVKIYELGHEMPPRLLPSSEPLSIKMAYWSFSYNSYKMRIPRSSFATSGNITWLNILDYTLDPTRQTDVLLGIDRSGSNPKIDLIRSFKRAKVYIEADASLASFDDGQKLVALGLYGPEGYEPYGMVADSLTVLQDYLPGPRGAVDYVMQSDINNYEKSENTTIWKDKFWFPVSLPHYGREICYSDGTTTGTQILADLAKGSKGIRIVRFAPAGDKMIILVQNEDLKVDLYELGSDIPSFDIAVEEDENWTKEFGAFPESELFIYNEGFEGRDDFVSGDDGFLYYLTRPGSIGTLMGDTPGVYGFNGEDDSFYEMQTARLKKIDAQTGQVIFSKPFRNSYFKAMQYGFKILSLSDELVVLSWGLEGYRDAEINIPTPEETVPQLIFTYFDKQGNYLRMQPVERKTSEMSVMFFSQLNNGNFLTVLKEPRDYYEEYRIQEIKADGSVVFDYEFKMKPNESLYFRKDEVNGGVYLSHYNVQGKNEDFNALFYRYASANGWEELGKLVYTGEMKNPDIFIKSNGDRWFTGALNGKLFLSDNTTNFDLSTTKNFYTTFSLRSSPTLGVFSDLTVLSNSATYYFGSITKDDEIYLQFLEADFPNPDLDFFNQQDLFRFNEPLNLQFQTVQLDKNAHESARKTQPWKVIGLKRPIHLTTVLTENNDWYQMVAAGKGNGVHVDTILPPPVLQHSMGYRLEMMRRAWGFQPTKSTFTDASPGDDGNIFKIFPNPNKGSFYILPNDGNRIPFSGYKIIDIQGRTVSSETLPETFNYLQLNIPSTLNAGIYQLQFEGEGISEMHRMVLIR